MKSPLATSLLQTNINEDKRLLAPVRYARVHMAFKKQIIIDYEKNYSTINIYLTIG